MFSIVDVLAKWLATDYPINQIVFFRMLFGLLPALYLLLQNTPHNVVLSTTRPLTHLWRAATGLGAMGLFFYALPLMPLADAVAISFTKPLLVTILAIPLLGEKLDRHRLIVVVTGFIGVLVIADPTGNFENWKGPAIAFGSAVCFSLSMITVRKLSKTESTAYIVFIYTAAATLVSGLTLFFAWQKPDDKALLLFFILGVIGGIGQLLMTAAFRHSAAIVIAPFSYTAILWASLFGFLIWGETVSATTFIGGAMIIGSGLYLFQRESNCT